MSGTATCRRARQVRNFLVTLFCSQGVPMLLAGDEMGRTQRGNNNGYCQDSPLSWVDWENAARYADLADFTGALSALRRAHPVFRRRRFFSGHLGRGGGPGSLRDIVWLTPSGREMTDEDWNIGYALRESGAVRICTGLVLATARLLGYWWRR